MSSQNETIYRCPTCGIELCGAAVNYHELATQHAQMEAIGYWHWNRWTGTRGIVKFQQQGDGDSREQRAAGADREIA